MSLLTHSFFPRSMFDMDLWNPGMVGPSTLDLFDAFDDLDRLMSRNLIWLNEPEALRLTSQKQPVSEKYRITLDCQGFNPNSIKTEIKDNNKLVVSASEGKPSATSDYSLREFRKTYDLPKNIDQNKLASFVTSNGQLVIEFPIKTTRLDLQPSVIDTKEGQKRVEITTEIPENVDPTKVTVTCKDRDVIVKADYKVDKEEGGKSKVHYYRRCTLPEHADLDNLKCVLENNKLNITAPMLPAIKKVPIEIRGQEQQAEQIQPQEQQQEQQPQQTWQPHIQQTQLGQAQQEWPQKEQEKRTTSETCPTCKGPTQRSG